MSTKNTFRSLKYKVSLASFTIYMLLVLALLFISENLNYESFTGETIFLLFILAVASFFIPFLFVHKLIKPLEHIKQSIEHFEQSKEVFVETSDDKGELGQLANNFQQILAKVQHNNDAFEAAIVEAKASSSQLQLILDSIADAVINIQECGNIISVNKTAEEMFGYQECEVLGKHITQLMPYEEGLKFEQLIEQCVQDKNEKLNRFGLEFPAMRKDGEIFAALFSVSEVITDSEKAFTFLIRDNTYSKLLESERKAALKEAKDLAWRLDFALSAPQIGVWDYNSISGRVAWDKRVYRLYGYEIDSGVLPEQIWLKSIHADDISRVKQAIENSLETGKDLNVNFRVLCPTKHIKHIECHAKAIYEHDGSIKRLVGTMSDITEHRLVSELKQKALDMAQESLKLKSEFLASMSHEIRTPMNGVLGMLGLLERSHLTDKQNHYVKLATSSGYLLLNLINDILDFSKVEAGKLDLEILDFDIVSHFGDIAESLALKAQEKDVEIILDTTQISSPNLKGDPSRIRQILTNLVGNAIKYTEQGEIVIKAKTFKVKGNIRLECSVIDSGIGIASEKLGSLFESFTQVDASNTRKYGGTGLGLAIVKKLCELMNGNITVKSQLGQGSTFTFDISLEANDVNTLAVEDVDLNNINVLIIDNNAKNQMIVERQLTQWGAKVLGVNSLLQAVEIIARQEGTSLDVAIIDMDLVNRSADNFSTLIAAIDKKVNIKLIAMTKLGEIKEADHFSRLGFSAYFPKPVTESDLRHAFNSILNSDSDKSSTQNYDSALTRSNNTDSGGSLKSTRILIVEDNRINQAVVQGILANYDASPDLADNGVEALRCLLAAPQQSPYEIILMDCQMPEMDGYQATKAIRAGKAGSHNQAIPIIAMTANAMKGDREKCLEVGMNDYLTKPIDADALYQMLVKLLGRSEPLKTSQNDIASDGVVSDSIAADNSELSKDNDEIDEFLCWDKAGLLKRVRGNQQLVNNLVELFVSDSPTLLKDLELAIDQEQIDNIIAHAHKLKGSASNLGALQLANVALQLEIHGKAKELAEIVALKPDLLSNYKILMDEFNNSLN